MIKKFKDFRVNENSNEPIEVAKGVSSDGTNLTIFL